MTSASEASRGLSLNPHARRKPSPRREMRCDADMSVPSVGGALPHIARVRTSQGLAFYCSHVLGTNVIWYGQRQRNNNYCSHQGVSVMPSQARTTSWRWNIPDVV
jgi:hypothetical protein